MSDQEEKDPGRYASEGMVWVCMACGKISPYDRYGDKQSTRGWDVSCMMNSQLIPEDKIVKGEDGRVTRIEE